MNHFNRKKNTFNSGSLLYSVVKLLKIVSSFYPSTYKPSFAAQWSSRVDFRVSCLFSIALLFSLSQGSSMRKSLCQWYHLVTLLNPEQLLAGDKRSCRLTSSGFRIRCWPYGLNSSNTKKEKKHDAGLIHQIQHEQLGQQLPAPLCPDCELKKLLSPKGSSFRLPSTYCSCWVVLFAIKVCIIVVTDKANQLN